MNVGVLGSGEVGTVLAAGFQAHGHKVMVGARTAAKLDAWAKQNSKIQIGTFADAAQFAELLHSSLDQSSMERLNSAGKRLIWVRSRRPAPSNRFVCSGAFLAFSTTIGCMHSRCLPRRTESRRCVTADGC
jgi:2-polyprenyl-6-methoxyphenol hydroxylase-like FAD-dependent oxidoreductase